MGSWADYRLPTITTAEWWLTRPLILGLSLAFTGPIIRAFRHVWNRIAPQASGVPATGRQPVPQPTGREARW
jgi:hypothetical protein